jgi:hypothetical protein
VTFLQSPQLRIPTPPWAASAKLWLRSQPAWWGCLDTGSSGNSSRVLGWPGVHAVALVFLGYHAQAEPPSLAWGLSPISLPWPPQPPVTCWAPKHMRQWLWWFWWCRQ